jgi:hypothetical protein
MKETEKEEEEEEEEEEREYEQCTKIVVLIYTAHSPHTPHHTTPHTIQYTTDNRKLHAHSPSSLFECLEDLQKGHVVSVAVSELAHTLHVFLLRLHASRMP